MSYFLLVYNRALGQRLVERRYSIDDRPRALADRSAFLAEYTDPDVEVVLLGADSYEDLRKTHGRYFQSPLEAASAR